MPLASSLHPPALSTEEIFAALEENIVTLSTMKASKYFVVFESEISHWEKTLSHISETIEMLLQVRGVGEQPFVLLLNGVCCSYSMQAAVAGGHFHSAAPA